MTDNNTPTASGEGYFGQFGGRFVPETLVAALQQLDTEFTSAMADESFTTELARCNREIGGRPSELYFCKRLTEQIGGAKIYLKREDMNHTGAHKINNTLGQALLCRQIREQPGQVLFEEEGQGVGVRGGGVLRVARRWSGVQAQAR